MKKLLVLFVLLITIITFNANAQILENLIDSSGFYQKKQDFETALKWAKLALHQAEKEFGKNNINYTYTLGTVSEVFYYQGKLDSAIYYGDIRLKIYRRLFKSDHPDLANSLNNLGFFYNYIADYKHAETLYKEALEMYRRIYKGDHPTLAASINNMAYFYSSRGDFKLAEPLFKEALKMNRNIYKGDHPSIAGCLNNMAVFYDGRGDYKQAETLYKEALEMRKRLFKEDHPDLARSINNMAIFYTGRGDFKQAEPLLEKALEMSRNIFPDDHPELANCINNMAYFYKERGDYKKAEPLYKEALKMYRRIYTGDHPSLAGCINNMGIFYYSRGDFKQAEPLYIEALEMTRRIFTEDHPDLAGSINNMAYFYNERGDYKKAEPLYKEALEITRRYFTSDHPDLARSIISMAIFYNSRADYKKAEPLYNEALEMYRRIFKDDHPDLANGINNLAVFYDDKDNYKYAEPLYIEALEMYRRLFKGDYPMLANCINNVGMFYAVRGDYKQAEFLLNEALEMKRRLFKGDHSDLASSINIMAYFYAAKGDYKQTELLFIELMSVCYKLINNYFPSLSEKEKEQFYSTISKYYCHFNNFAALLYKKSPKLIESMFNNQLLTKGMLLSASGNVRSRIISSNDTTLIELFSRWKDKKEYIAKLYQLSNAQLREKNINLDSLEQVANDIEKELSLKSELFAKEYEKKNIVWQDVQSKLKDGEAAIELIRFNYFDKVWTDTVYYAALIVTKNTKEYPELVLLRNGNELDLKYNEVYQKVIELQRENRISKEESDSIMSELYNQYWKPIEEKLHGISKVYLSLDGVYNLLNLETLINPATGKYLIDEIDLQLITGTKDLVFSAHEMTRKDNIADLFGRPNYKLNKESRQKLAMNLKKGEKQYFSENTLRDLSRLNINDLPGTEIEINNISKVMKDKSWDVNVFKGDSALEEAVKAIDNPKVLHIATHGYFLSDNEFERKSEARQLSTKTFGIESSKAYENPLLRSGLLFAGAERELDTNYIPTSLTDNGILTAYEAMNLNLDNTELVVLSACQTGLGKIKNGEGVYGLQRAFKVAGAKAIIMSLWKVSDEATQELMTSFYTKWLEGKTKRQAFHEAKHEMIILHPEPYYWGAFVMLGE